MLSNIKIIEHNDTGETLVTGFDHDPYSAKTFGIPDDIVDASRTGLAFNIPDFDCRDTEWRRNHV